jgi:hypothetical protein
MTGTRAASSPKNRSIEKLQRAFADVRKKSLPVARRTNRYRLGAWQLKVLIEASPRRFGADQQAFVGPLPGQVVGLVCVLPMFRISHRP